MLALDNRGQEPEAPWVSYCAEAADIASSISSKAKLKNFLLGAIDSMSSGRTQAEVSTLVARSRAALDDEKRQIVTAALESVGLTPP